MYKRKITEEIMNWYNNDKKCLYIRGARKVGKTTIIMEFLGGINKTKIVVIDFSVNKEAFSIFDGDLDLKTLENLINTYLLKRNEKQLVPYESIIYLDEIQLCPNAFQSVKSFADSPYKLIVSGSLIEANPKEQYPIDCVKSIEMFPFSFEEFLWAKGVNEDYYSNATTQIIKDKRVNLKVHETLLDLFLSYIITGGMPLAIRKSIEDNEAKSILESLEQIYEGNHQDVKRFFGYKAAGLYENLYQYSQLENKKFVFKQKLSKEDKKRQMRDYDDSFDLLHDYGYIRRVHNVDRVEKPLDMWKKDNDFKTYMHDSGVLSYKICEAYGLDYRNLLENPTESKELSYLIETQLVSLLRRKEKYQIFYYKGYQTPITDFIVQTNRGLIKAIDIELNINKQSKKLASLKNRFPTIDEMIKITIEQYSVVDNIVNLPIYMIETI